MNEIVEDEELDEEVQEQVDEEVDEGMKEIVEDEKVASVEDEEVEIVEDGEVKEIVEDILSKSFDVFPSRSPLLATMSFLKLTSLNIRPALSHPIPHPTNCRNCRKLNGLT